MDCTAAISCMIQGGQLVLAEHTEDFSEYNQVFIQEYKMTEEYIVCESPGLGPDDQ